MGSPFSKQGAHTTRRENRPQTASAGFPLCCINCCMTAPVETQPATIPLDQAQTRHQDQAEKTEDLIASVLPGLMECLEVSPTLIARLEATKVLDEESKQNLKVQPTNMEKVEKLMTHIKRDVQTRFQPLIEALKETNQPGPVRLLTLPEVMAKVDELEGRDDDLARCTQKLAEAYRRYSEQFSLFKNKPGYHSYTVHLGQLFTKLSLIHNKLSRFVTETCSINLAQAFEGSDKNTLLIGFPGSGKSSLGLYIANSWGEIIQGPETSSVESDLPIPEILRDIKLLVYVRTQDHCDSLDQTVEMVLQKICGEDSEAAIKCYKNKKSVGIILDSLDEIENWKESKFKKDIFDLMNKSQVYVIAGVRKNHPVIDKLHGESHIRYIQVEGFDEADIYNYIRKFFSMPGCSQDLADPFIKIIEKDERLKGLLGNPLTLTLLCFLVAEGQVKIEEIKGIKKIEIYSMIEEMMAVRDNLEIKSEQMSETFSVFHKYALLSLINNAELYENELKGLGVNLTDLPFITCGDCKIGAPSKGRKLIFSHKSFEEYSASKFLSDCDHVRQTQILAFLATQRELYPILEMMLEAIQLEERDYETIINMVLCAHMTVEDHSGSCTGKGSLEAKDTLSKLPATDVLDKDLDLSLKESLGKVRPCSDCWMKMDWGEGTKDKQEPALDAAVNLIHSIQDRDKQVTIFENTIGKVLQRRWRPRGKTYIPVPATTRCISVRELSPGDVNIATSRPGDITPTRPLSLRGSRSLKKLRLGTDRGGGIYGPHTTPSTGEWVDLLTYIVHQGPQFEGDGALYIGHSSPTTSHTPALTALPDCLQPLYQRGVRMIRLFQGNVTSAELVSWVQRLRSQGWRTTAGGEYVGTVITRTEPERMEMRLQLEWTLILSRSEDEQQYHRVIIDELNLCHGNVSWKLED